MCVRVEREEEWVGAIFWYEGGFDVWVVYAHMYKCVCARVCFVCMRVCVCVCARKSV